MRIDTVGFRQVRIPLNFQFRQSNNSGTSSSASAIVELHMADGVTGYGESCPRSYVTGESMADVAQDVQQLRSQLVSEPIHSPAELQQKLTSWAGLGIGASTRCALELAWLDAWSRSQGRSLQELLGITTGISLSYSMVLPLLSSRTLAGLLQGLAHLRPPAIKLKVDENQSGNLTCIEVIREHYGPEMPIRVDVNGGWTRDQAKVFLPELLDAGIQSFEQPLDPADLEGLQQLTQLFGDEVLIMADESLLGPESARYLLENRICNHFNLKISKLGGLLSSLEVYQLAAEHGIACQLGAHFGETSLLTSAGALLAAMVDGKLSACEGALGQFLLSADICEPSIQQDRYGKLTLQELWRSPGLAGSMRQDQIAAFTVAQ